MAAGLELDLEVAQSWEQSVVLGGKLSSSQDYPFDVLGAWLCLGCAGVEGCTPFPPSAYRWKVSRNGRLVRPRHRPKPLPNGYYDGGRGEYPSRGFRVELNDWYGPLQPGTYAVELTLAVRLCSYGRVRGAKVAATPLLFELMPDGSVRQDSPKRPTVPSLIAALSDHRGHVVSDAAMDIGAFGADARDAVPKLVGLLSSQDEEVRRSAAYGLSEIGEPAMPALVSLLTKGDALAKVMAADVVRRSGGGLLGEVPEYLAQAVDPLTAALSDRDERVREKSAKALAAVGPLAVSAVPHLVAALTDESWSVKVEAAHALGKIGPGAREAVPALAAAVSGEDGFLRRRAMWALGNIGKDAVSAVPVLVEALRDDDYEARWSAANALSGIGPAAKPALPALLAALSDENDAVRSWAVLAIASVSPDAEVGCPAIAKCLSDSSPTVRRDAAMALGDIGANANAAIPALTQALNDKDELVRWWAERSLRDIREATAGRVRDDNAQPTRSTGAAVEDAGEVEANE